MESQEVFKKFWANFKDHYWAGKFLLDYYKLIHLIDDIIDEKIIDPKIIINGFNLSRDLYSNPFYQQNVQVLYMVAALISNSYEDSLSWESEEGWKKAHADIIRHNGLDMFYAVLLLISGRDKVREISLEFREFSHKEHLTDLIKSYGHV